MPFCRPLVGLILAHGRHSSRTGHQSTVTEQLHNVLVSKAHISTALIHVYLQIVMIIAQKWHQLQLQSSENISDLWWLEQQHRNYNHLTSIPSAPSLDYSSQQTLCRKTAQEEIARAFSTKEIFLFLSDSNHFTFLPSSFFNFKQYPTHKQNKKKIHNFWNCPLMCCFLRTESTTASKKQTQTPPHPPCNGGFLNISLNMILFFE